VATEGLLLPRIAVDSDAGPRSRVKIRRYVRRRTYAIKNFVYWFT
jgi:hypothetical protein